MWNDSISVRWFSVYAYVHVGVISEDGDVQKFNLVVLFYFIGKLNVTVYGVKILFYGTDVGVLGVIHDEYIIDIPEVIDYFTCFGYSWKIGLFHMLQKDF
jgi:hypothetical protein